LLEPKKALEARKECKAILKYKKNFLRPNLTHEEIKGMREIKALEDVVILKTDKGNATVILDKKDYEEKALKLLQGGGYKMLKRDPTGNIERELKLRMKRTAEVFTDEERRLINPTSRAHHRSSLDFLKSIKQVTQS